MIAPCRHGFRSDFWLPCPTCRPEEAALIQGNSATAEQTAVQATNRKKSAMIGVPQPRLLELDGKTLAGCKVGHEAANATALTRYHVTFSCGHPGIANGTDLKSADKAGKVLRCKPCQVAESLRRKQENRKVRDE